jgi:hypothetical protein
MNREGVPHYCVPSTEEKTDGFDDIMFSLKISSFLWNDKRAICFACKLHGSQKEVFEGSKRMDLVFLLGTNSSQLMHCCYPICSYMTIFCSTIFRSLLVSSSETRLKVTIKRVPEDDPNRHRSILEQNIAM